MLARIASGAIRVPGGDAAALLRVLVDIARLEAGEATSAAVIAHLSGEDVRARVEGLRQQAAAVLAVRSVELASAAARAVADVGADVPPTGDGVPAVGGPISAELVEGEGF